jgi:hypothetical protein
MSGGGWTWLEVAKLAAAAATPIVVVGAGFFLNRRLKGVEQAQWSTQKIIERRIVAYDEIVGPANDLYCYFCYIGSWKELTPPGAVRLKRILDKTVYTNVPLFEAKFKDLYEDLTGDLFATFGSWGADAKLKTLTDRRQQVSGREWDPTWDDCFVERGLASEPDDVKRSYGRFMAYLAESIGVQKADEHLLGAAQTPGNFDMRAAGIVSIGGTPAQDDG